MSVDLDQADTQVHVRARRGLHPVGAPLWSPELGGDPSIHDIASMIDHTLLKPGSTRLDLERVCAEALTHGFFSVCIHSGNVPLVAHLLKGSDIKVCAVVGFPLGSGTPASKAFETREAIAAGANEVDMVMNLGALRSRDFELVHRDIAAVVAAAQGCVVKVILETSTLDEREKVMGCAIACSACASFVKTSTGFGPGGATFEDVALMREIVGDHVGVKASGGVRDWATAVAMVRAGANRLGCSSSVAIVTGSAAPHGGY